jgi:hypothetical protein
MREVLGVGTKYEKIFAKSVPIYLSPCGRDSDFNSLAERLSEAKC